MLLLYNQEIHTPATLIRQSNQIENGADALDIATIHVESYLVGNSCSSHAAPIVEEVSFNHALKTRHRLGWTRH
jgi:hypothetical protein